MVGAEKQQLLINDLCKRLGKSKEAILDCALQGELPLWIAIHDMYLLPDGYQPHYEKDRMVYPPEHFHTYAEIRLDSQTLSQIKDMNGPMLIVSELACFNENEEPVTLLNVADETYGETSIIGINTSQLFVKIDAIEKFETKSGRQTALKNKKDTDLACEPEAAPASTLNPKDHAYHAEELFIATHCWQALFASGEEAAKNLKKTDIKVWITEHYPTLSGTAVDRIATVVNPLRK